MIRDELAKEGYEMWQPPLGGPGVMCHPQRPELFAAGGGSGSGVSQSSRAATPAGSHQNTPSIKHKK